MPSDQASLQGSSLPPFRHRVCVCFGRSGAAATIPWAKKFISKRHLKDKEPKPTQPGGVPVMKGPSSPSQDKKQAFASVGPKGGRSITQQAVCLPLPVAGQRHRPFQATPPPMHSQFFALSMPLPPGGHLSQTLQGVQQTCSLLPASKPSSRLLPIEGFYSAASSCPPPPSCYVGKGGLFSLGRADGVLATFFCCFLLLLGIGIGFAVLVLVFALHAEDGPVVTLET